MDIDYADPKTLLKAVATSGMLFDPSYLEDEECFKRRAIGKWHQSIGNTLSCETEKHEHMASELYELYAMVNEFIQAHKTITSKIFYSVFKALLAGDLDQAYRQYGKAKDSAMSSLKNQC